MLCECGCGNPAPIAQVTRRERGWIKGQPLRFIMGHTLLMQKGKLGPLSKKWKGGRKVEGRGYVLVYAPDHPRSHQNYIYEHTQIAEKALGHYLPPNAVVHHYSKQQLVICENLGYHALIHRRTRAIRVCGHASWRKCSYCGQYGDAETMKIFNINSSAYHRECYKLNERERHKKRKLKRRMGNNGNIFDLPR